MPRTYSPAQQTYIIARAAYEVARDEANAHMAEYEAMCDANEASMSSEEYEAWCAERRNDGPSPVLVAQTRALDTLRKAERALIDWCLNAVSGQARTPEHRAALDRIRDVKPWQVKAYDGAIDLAMRLDA